MNDTSPPLVDPNTPPLIAPFLAKLELKIFSFADEELSIQMTPPFPKAKFSSNLESVMLTSAFEFIVNIELSKQSLKVKIKLLIMTFKGRILVNA